MHHHAGERTARALAPVRPAPGRRSPAPISLQGQPHPVVAALAAVLRHQLLVEVLGGEVPVAGVEQLKHPRHFVHRRATCREAAQAAIVETLRAFRLKAIAPAPEGALRDAQDLRRLRLAQHTATGAPVNLFELHQSQPLCLLRPTHPNPPWPGSLLKPDRSSGTWPDISRVTDTCWVCGCHRRDVRLMFCHAQPLEIRPPHVPRRLRGALSR